MLAIAATMKIGPKIAAPNNGATYFQNQAMSYLLLTYTVAQPSPRRETAIGQANRTTALYPWGSRNASASGWKQAPQRAVW